MNERREYKNPLFSKKNSLSLLKKGMNTNFKFDKSQIKIVKRDEQASDFAFWRSQSYVKRLMALEKLRQEYNTWKYGTGLQFQRVYSITQRS
jgi:hypothetical protein